MDRSLDMAELQPACKSPAIDYATALSRAYAQFSPLPVNGANNAANDVSAASVQAGNECESTSARLTPVDELLTIDHWKPAEAQYCKAIADHYQVGKRSIQKWFVDLLKLVQAIAPGVAETDLRQADRYTPLAVELLGHRYFAGSSKKWATVLAEQYGDRLQALQPAQPAAAPHAASTKDVPLSKTEVLPRDGEASSEASNRPEDVVEYERSVTLDRLINGRLTPKSPQSPEQNSVFLQVQEKLNRLQQQREQTRHQIQHTAQSHMDTAEALDVLEDIELIERIRAKAQRHFQLEQDVYREELDLLKTQTVLGK